jgi:hypothetical protein
MRSPRLSSPPSTHDSSGRLASHYSRHVAVALAACLLALILGSPG